MRSGRPPKARVSGHRSPTTLRYLRTLLGISQKQLADVSGVSQTAISDYENGLAMPVEQAYNLHAGVGTLAQPEHVSLVRGIFATDLPRPWETVMESVSVEDKQYVTN